MELEQYVRLIRRWWWVSVVTAVILGGIVYAYGRTLDPIYQAETKVFIGGFLENPNPGVTEIQTSNDLALTYANLLVVRPTLDNTIDELQLNIEAGELQSKVSARIIPDTSILIVGVRDTSPVIAANIANELAHQLIANSPTRVTPDQVDRRQLIETEIDALLAQVAEGRETISEVEIQLEGIILNSEERLRLQTLRGDLIAQNTEWQQTIANLSSSLSDIETQTHTLAVVEPALPSDAPVGPQVLRNAILAALVGVVLGIGIAFMWEYFDDTFRGPEDVRETLNLPVLAGITKFGQDREGYSDKLVTLHSPHSTPVEGYRALRTNLLYGLGENQQGRRFIVTSSREKEGKSVTAANMAVILAKAEFNTVLIDADLHRPQIHNIFDLENKIGLSTLFKMSISPSQLLGADELGQLIQPTVLPYLKVITSGPIPANPAELVGLPHMRMLCRSLEENDTDIIIFDSPPILNVVDSTILASNIDASVVMVVNSDTTRRKSSMNVVTQFEHVGVKVAGIVLNRVSSKTEGYNYYYYSYGAYGPVSD